MPVFPGLVLGVLGGAGPMRKICERLFLYIDPAGHVWFGWKLGIFAVLQDMERR